MLTTSESYLLYCKEQKQEAEIERILKQINVEINSFKCKTDELLCEITIQMLELLRKYWLICLNELTK